MGRRPWVGETAGQVKTPRTATRRVGKKEKEGPGYGRARKSRGGGGGGGKLAGGRARPAAAGRPALFSAYVGLSKAKRPYLYQRRATDSLLYSNCRVAGVIYKICKRIISVEFWIWRKLVPDLEGRVPNPATRPARFSLLTPEVEGSPIGGEKLQNPNDLLNENQALRERLSRLSEASLRITEDLDLDIVLQGVVDGARSLTGARMGGITALDEQGQLQDFITSGLTPEEHQRFVDLPGGPEFFAYLSMIPRTAPAGGLLRPHHVGGPSRNRPAVGSGGHLPGRAHPSPGRARRQPLSIGQGGRPGVHPGRMRTRC